MSAPLPQRLAAEALGTGLLVAAVIGSGIMADRLTDDVALALLANTIATAAALFALVTAFLAVSGAQFNPAVTLVALMRGGLSGSEAAARIAVQVIGGLCGTILAHAMFSLPLWQAAATMRSGGPQWLAEGVATFGLVLSILGAQRATGAPVAATVALYIAAAYWFTSSTSFANPAVTLARAFSDSFAGIRPVDVPAFVLAQLAGAGLAAGLAGWLFRSDAGTEEK